ncbi:MAG: alkaline phosphatase PhoX [Motilibacteraceae bacterium]
MSLSRRQLLGRSAIGGAGLLAASTGLGTLAASPALADARPARRGGSSRTFPPLQSRDGDLLALPEGFSYEVVAVSGKTDLHDGTGKLIGKTPERPDGTAAVAARGHRWRLIQNHETEAGAGEDKTVPLVPGTVYDPAGGVAGGGCTVIETRADGSRLSEWVGISGTVGNCAGGPSPWGTWFTCEETEATAGENGYEKDHGYVFEVFPGLPHEQAPEPIKAWGRAAHEAVVVEPRRRRVYLTEDASGKISDPDGQPRTGLLYRWTAPSHYRVGPYVAKALGADDGALEALAVLADDGGVLPDLAYVTAAQIGRPFRTRWVAVPDRQASTTSLRKQFHVGQVTHSKKLEGATGDRDGMYFVASFAFGTNDLPADATKHDGQLWYYDYADETLTLVAYFPYSAQLHDEAPGWEQALGRSIDLSFDGPDGCHVSPYGSVVLTEDGNTANHVLSWTREGGAQAVARNLIVQEQNSAGGNVYSEMTGPAFSPDGTVLFANVQEPGHVFAIRGPWKHYLG